MNIVVDLWLISFAKTLVLFVFYLQISGENMFNFAAFIEVTMRLIVYAILFLISSGLFGQEKKSVVVINDTSKYLEQVRENPNNELLDLEDFIPGLKLDIRFATINNIVGEKIYASPKAFVRKPMAVSLEIIQEALNRRGFGLVIYDAYRPFSIVEKIDEQMKNPADEALLENSVKHSRGASVDVSLFNLATGEEVQMPSGYCQKIEATNTNYQDLPDNVLENREILIQVMQQHGFRVNPNQWWHFDFMGWQAFELMDLSFEEIENMNKYLK